MKPVRYRERKSERTRAAILKAAQELFAEFGYARTTVRDIAARAAIDPAMVMRYFGSKDALFARATAIDLKLPDLTQTAPAQFGDTLIRHFLDIWEGLSSTGILTILLRTSASDEDVAAKMRNVFAGQVLPCCTGRRPRRGRHPGRIDRDPTARPCALPLCAEGAAGGRDDAGAHHREFRSAAAAAHERAEPARTGRSRSFVCA